MLVKQLTKWLVGGIFFIVSISSALADFRICNSTQRLIGAAIGYRAATGWISEGWWRIEPASCKTVIEGPLSSRFYYLYAEDVADKSRWDGPVNMCVRESEFKIEGVNDCFARGFLKFGFKEIDTNNQISWMVQLTEPTSNTSSANNNKNTGP